MTNACHGCSDVRPLAVRGRRQHIGRGPGTWFMTFQVISLGSATTRPFLVLGPAQAQRGDPPQGYRAVKPATPPVESWSWKRGASTVQMEAVLPRPGVPVRRRF